MNAALIEADDLDGLILEDALGQTREDLTGTDLDEDAGALSAHGLDLFDEAHAARDLAG